MKAYLQSLTSFFKRKSNAKITLIIISCICLLVATLIIHYGNLHIYRNPELLVDFMHDIIAVLVISITASYLFSEVLSKKMNLVPNILKNSKYIICLAACILIIYNSYHFTRQLPNYVCSMEIRGDILTNDLLTDDTYSFYSKEKGTKALIIYSKMGSTKCSESFKKIKNDYSTMLKRLHHGILSNDPCYQFVPLDSWEGPELSFRTQTLFNVLFETEQTLTKLNEKYNKSLPALNLNISKCRNSLQAKHDSINQIMNAQINFLRSLSNFFNGDPNSVFNEIKEEVDSISSRFKAQLKVRSNINIKLSGEPYFANLQSSNISAYENPNSEGQDQTLKKQSKYLTMDFQDLNKLTAQQFASIYRNESGAYSKILFITPDTQRDKLDMETINKLEILMIQKYKNYFNPQKKK